MRSKGASREEIWRGLARLGGWYVPELYRERTEEEAQQAGSCVEPVEAGVPAIVEKQLFGGFSESSAWEPCIVPFTEVVHDITEQCHAGSRVFQHSLVVFHGHGLHDARQDAEFDVPGGFKIIKLGVEIDYDLIGGHLGSGGLDYSIPACYQIVPDKFVGIRGRIETIRQFRQFFNVRDID